MATAFSMLTISRAGQREKPSVEGGRGAFLRPTLNNTLLL